MKKNIHRRKKIKYAFIGNGQDISLQKFIYQNFLNSYLNILYVKDDNFTKIVNSRRFLGLRIENPYKKDVIPLLTDVTNQVSEIGEVDLVHNYKGRLYGFNTSYYGYIKLFEKKKIQIKDKIITVLSRNENITLMYVLNKLGAKEVLSSKSQTEILPESQVLISDINFDIEEYKIKLNHLKNLEAVVDLNYNPIYSRLILDARKLKMQAVNASSFALYKEKKAIEIIDRTKYDDNAFEDLLNEYIKTKINIVLVGMPGAGKTTIGKKLAKLLFRKQVDLDKEFTFEYGITPARYLTDRDEASFREMESVVVKKFLNYESKVISTSGGVVQNLENYYYLKRNSIIFRVDRDLDKLSTYNRPLSRGGIETLEKMSINRKEKYDYFTDYVVKNTGNFDKVAYDIIAKINEIY